MKKPSFTDALAQVHSTQAASNEDRPANPKDGRINTTLRISPEGLEKLKIIAARKRIRVNDLLLQGAELVLDLNGEKMQLRK